jgi:hypothetical protein
MGEEACMFDDTTQVDPHSQMSQPPIASGGERPSCVPPRATGRGAVLIDETPATRRRNNARALLAHHIQEIDAASSHEELAELARAATDFTRDEGAVLPAEDCGRIVFAVLRARARLARVAPTTRPLARIRPAPRAARSAN